MNATWRDGSVQHHEAINIGIAVATDEALIVPVVHGADRLGVESRGADTAATSSRERATANYVPPTSTEGTFTISNLGMFGVDAFHAIVNAPQAAILAVGRILERIVAVDGNAAVRPTMTLTPFVRPSRCRRRRRRPVPRHAGRARRGAGRVSEVTVDSPGDD